MRLARVQVYHERVFMCIVFVGLLCESLCVCVGGRVAAAKFGVKWISERLLMVCRPINIRCAHTHTHTAHVSLCLHGRVACGHYIVM